MNVAEKAGYEENEIRTIYLLLPTSNSRQSVSGKYIHREVMISLGSFVEIGFDAKCALAMAAIGHILLLNSQVISEEKYRPELMAEHTWPVVRRQAQPWGV